MSRPQKNPDLWTAAQLRVAIEAAGVALWSWNVDTDRLTMDSAAYALWGADTATDVCFEDLSEHIHPADRDRVRAAFAATRGIVGSYEIDFRILVDAEDENQVVRWISARGQGDDSGIVGRVMFGVFLDVTGRKQAEEANELLAGEMSHRVKNLLTIASALTTISSRSTTTAAEMAGELTQRLAALGRAHDLVRPVPGHGDTGGALLGDLISILLAPYDDLGAFTGRVRVSVPRMGVGEGAATTLALVMHELATNSLKYGALSSPEGTLDVSCVMDHEDVCMVWTERGGPPVRAPSTQGGFGSRMMNRGIVSHLGGSIAFDWPEAGAIVTLRMRKARLLT